MAGYVGYTGYDEDSVKRQRAIADELARQSSQVRPIRHWSQGVAQLAEAWLAKDADRKASEAEKAYKTSQQQIADQLIGQAFPDAQGVAQQQLAQPAAFDLTPKAAEQRQTMGGIGDQAKLVARMTGNPLMGIQYGQQMQDRMKPKGQFLQGANGAISWGDQDTGTVRQLQPGTPPPEDPTKYEFKEMMGKQGPGIYAIDPTDPTKEPVFRGKLIPKEGSGQSPPSGYRYTADGRGLEPIPGGPADKAPGAGMDPDTIKLEREYAKDWKGVQSNFQDIDSQFNRMQSMANRGDAAGDLALVVSFTKMLDPGSVAREGEVALTQKAASLVDQAGNWINQLQNGQTLLPAKVRQQLLEAGREMHGVYKNAYQKLGKNYYETAKSYQYDPARVMMGYDADGIARDEAIRSASGNPWPTIRAGVQQSGLTPDEQAELEALRAELGQR